MVKNKLKIYISDSIFRLENDVYTASDTKEY